MKCPKCGSDRVETDFCDPTADEYLICKACGCLWTSWQQKRIDALTEGLRKLEWADHDEDEYCVCPVCQALPKTQAINNGHKPVCWLSKLIGGGE